MDRVHELERFKKSFLLHASRYNLYAEDARVKGSTKTHNQAVKALGKLQVKVAEEPPLYSYLLLEFLMGQDAKAVVCAAFICLSVNLHTDQALERLSFIAKNTPGLSMICDFDMRGHITAFRKRAMEAKPHNEVDEIAKKMQCTDDGAGFTDEELLDMILRLPNVDLCGHDGRTPLIHACISNRPVLAGELIARGADANRKDLYQKTALHCATITGNKELVFTLLLHQANVNEQDRFGLTALDFAKANSATLSQEEVDGLIELLVSYGAKTKRELGVDLW